jgi:hypothetical protein
VTIPVASLRPPTGSTLRVAPAQSVASLRRVRVLPERCPGARNRVRVLPERCPSWPECAWWGATGTRLCFACAAALVSPALMASAIGGASNSPHAFAYFAPYAVTVAHPLTSWARFAALRQTPETVRYFPVMRRPGYESVWERPLPKWRRQWKKTATVFAAIAAITCALVLYALH